MILLLLLLSRTTQNLCKYSLFAFSCLHSDSERDELIIFEFLFQFCIQNMGAKCFFKMEGIRFILLVDAIKMHPDSRKMAIVTAKDGNPCSETQELLVVQVESHVEMSRRARGRKRGLLEVFALE